MTLLERDERMREEGRAEGFEKGHKEGREEGHEEERKNTLREKARADEAEKQVALLKEQLSELRTR